jgi:hypothetical protein
VVGTLLAKATLRKDKRLVPFQTICANLLAALDHVPCNKAGCSNSAYQVGTALATNEDDYVL